MQQTTELQIYVLRIQRKYKRKMTKPKQCHQFPK